MPKLGIFMEGGEAEFIATVCAAMLKFEYPHYVEVGVAYGETLYGVWMAVKGIPNACVTGIQIDEWEGWDCIHRFFKDEPDYCDNHFGFLATVLHGRSTEVLSISGFRPISVAFIDACHGKSCVMADFLAVEPLTRHGSIVIFHDACIKCQGTSMQPHCNEPIGVRLALRELGLFNDTETGCVRSGWHFIGMLPTINECAVFERTTK